MGNSSSTGSSTVKRRRRKKKRSRDVNTDERHPIRSRRPRVAPTGVANGTEAFQESNRKIVGVRDAEGSLLENLSLLDYHPHQLVDNEEVQRRQRSDQSGAFKTSRNLEIFNHHLLSHSNMSDLVQQLQRQVQELQERLREKDDIINTLERQLNFSRREKEIQVTGMKQSVEMVIKEKDSEIRRLKALWSPHEALQADVVDAALVTGVSENSVPETSSLEQRKAMARYGISAENRSSSSSQQLFAKTDIQPKDQDEVSFIRRALHKNAFLKGLDAKQVNELIDCMSRQVVATSFEIITEGEYGTHMFILERGQVEVFHTSGKERHHVVNLRPGAVFGELAILYNCKRTACVQAQTEVSLWCLERKDFQAIVKRSGLSKQTEYVRLLKTVEKLKSLPDKKLMRIADCLEEATFNKGDYIIRQGDTGDTFYIIQEGKVNVTHTKEIPHKKKKKKKEYIEEFVCFLEKGKYFGESALLTEERRSANIVADSSTVVVLMLDRTAFNSLVGSLADIDRAVQDDGAAVGDHGVDEEDFLYQLSVHEEEEDEEESEDEDTTEVDGALTTGSSSVPTRLSRAVAIKIKNVPFDKLNTVQILGQGGFGCVKLVTVPGLSSHSFALKAIRKARIVKTGQQKHVLAEKNILLDMRSNFIGKLHRTYKDELRIYLLMDAYLGGDVYGVLKKIGGFSDAIARFYAACVLEAIEYLHLRGIIYRDLKPENLMLDHKGYVKLVDFGFAKRLRYGFKTYTFCGTPEYFPPEIISNTGHDFAADYWSYGILIYEFLTRSTPFYSSDDMSIYENILGGIEGVRFSKRVSRNAEILIRGLCKLEPRDRLGYQRGGIGDIRKQRWFQGFDWLGLRSNRVLAPFDPDVRDPTDTRNFDRVIEKSFDKKEDRKILKEASMAWDATF